MEFNKRKSEEIAQQLLGMDFEIGGRGENKKIDCYGVLVLYYGSFDIKMPDYQYQTTWVGETERYLKEYSSMFTKLPPDEKPQIGDMILFHPGLEPAIHAGIYIGDNRFVHSCQKIGTKIDSLINSFWKNKIYGYFRIKKDAF